MGRFSNENMTVQAQEMTYEIDYNEKDILLRGVKYIDYLTLNSSFFIDALKQYMKQKKEKISFSGNIENLEDIYSFLKECYSTAGIKGDKGKGKKSYNPSLMKKWLKSEMLPSREEAHRICFCLKMNSSEAEKFLFKGCLMKPFNFKDISEIIYYFCLNTNRNYDTALYLIDKLNSTETVITEFPENDTRVIEEHIKQIDKEADLISYINYNKKGFEKQSREALKTLKKQIYQSVELAEWERFNYFKEYGIPSIHSVDDCSAILNVILGYEARANENGKEVYRQKISKSKFHRLIKDNFPQPQQLNNMLKSDVPSVEGLRKAIILFVFYNMFTELKRQKINNSGGKYFDEFCDEVDLVLDKCGYIQMYWRNPYDWMIGYCAGAENPLDELRELISFFYLDEEDIYLQLEGK